ncbi:MAG: ATP-binding protein [Candidatus Zixiibacteriota bacterium]
MPYRIVITGAPASGKTEIFGRLKGHPALAGFVFLDELARRLLAENPHYRRDWAGFHREIYCRQVEREKAAGGRSFVTDRGTVDAFAFHPETIQEVGTTLEAEYARYTLVIHLGSAAALGHEYYCRDTIRHESAQEALRIEDALREVWQAHPGYHFIRADEDFEKKYQACCTLIEGGL